VAPTADRISQIQQALAKDGSFTGEPTGKWDDATVDAMRRFQEAHGLNPTGKLDAKTLQQLGLGSSTTGLAPPMPAANSSSANLKSAQTASRQ
jgi:peptidoglycan hydrolase-like protein with peptidoglycan-binding domain